LSEGVELVLRASLIGIGATMVMDFWALVLKYVFKTPSLNWGMVGRWLGHLSKGTLNHTNISEASPVRAEVSIGWIAHYFVGIVFAALLIGIIGLEWARQPTFLPAIIFGLLTVVFPFFIMQPGMGAGIAASKTPNPALARKRSVITHTVFGIGLYCSAELTALLIGV
jgi:hypothetical protein